MKKNNKGILIFSIISVVLFFGGVILYTNSNIANITTNNKNVFSYNSTEQEDFVYLSDLDYIEDNNWSYTGYGSLKKDKNIEDGVISLIVNGTKKIFVKGMGIHATGQVTYDISNLSNKYSKFLTKAGVDSSKEANGSVTFEVLVSNDGNSWLSLYKTGILKGNSEADSIDVSIAGYKYLRIYVNKSINGNSYDHAVLGDCKLVKSDYVENQQGYSKIHNLEYYDNILSNNSVQNNINNNYRLILEREFVNKIGYDEIAFYDKFGNKGTLTAVVDWLDNKNADINNDNNSVESEDDTIINKNDESVKGNFETATTHDEKTKNQIFKINYIVLFVVILCGSILIVVVLKQKKRKF